MTAGEIARIRDAFDDPSTIASYDGDGAIRLWDATTGREAMRLDDKAGLALDVLSLANAPLCKQAPAAVETQGSGEEPLPPTARTLPFGNRVIV